MEASRLPRASGDRPVHSMGAYAPELVAPRERG